MLKYPFDCSVCGAPLTCLAFFQFNFECHEMQDFLF